MAVLVPTLSLTDIQEKKIKKDLTFYAKVNKNLKYEQEAKELTCYRADSEFTSLPLAWCKKEFELRNKTSYHEKVNIDPLSFPWSEKQQNEYDDLIEKLLEEKTTVLNIRTAAG